MTWPYHQTPAGVESLRRREARDDDFIGGHVVGVEDVNFGVIGASQKLMENDADSCPFCDMPMGACTTAEHDRTAPLLTGHDELMAQNQARRTTTRPRRNQPVGDLPSASNPNADVEVIATGEENATFTTAQVNQPVEQHVLTPTVDSSQTYVTPAVDESRTYEVGAPATFGVGDGATGDPVVHDVNREVVVSTEVVSEVAPVPSPVLVTEVAQATDESRVRIQGEPRGYVVDPGQSLKGMPVRRVEGSNDIVQTREDVWVRQAITGSKRKTFTLLLAVGTDLPLSQLDSTAP